MKLVALILTLTTAVSMATGTRWIAVQLPTHVLYVDEGPPGGITEVPCVTSASATFERTLSLMNSPYTPHHLTWNHPSDVNLISLYGLKISGKYDTETNPDNPKLHIVIDLTKSAKPEGYPFSVAEVVEKVSVCEIELRSRVNRSSLGRRLRGENKTQHHKSDRAGGSEA